MNYSQTCNILHFLIKWRVLLHKTPVVYIGHVTYFPSLCSYKRTDKCVSFSLTMNMIEETTSQRNKSLTSDSKGFGNNFFLIKKKKGVGEKSKVPQLKNISIVSHSPTSPLLIFPVASNVTWLTSQQTQQRPKIYTLNLGKHSKKCVICFVL